MPLAPHSRLVARLGGAAFENFPGMLKGFAAPLRLRIEQTDLLQFEGEFRDNS